MSKQFDDNGFSLSPKGLHENAWFYEGKDGITIVQQMQGTLQGIVGDVTISWRRLEPTIKRYMAYKRRRRKGNRVTRS